MVNLSLGAPIESLDRPKSKYESHFSVGDHMGQFSQDGENGKNVAFFHFYGALL